MKKLSLFYLIPFLLFGGCSLFEDKVDENKIDEGEVLEIKDQELSFSIFQIVSIDLGETIFSNGQIVGTTLEGEKIDLFIEDNVLNFMVPKLNQGSYKLIFSENNKPFNIAFEVKSHELKDTPEAYLAKFKNIALEQIAALEKSKSILPEDKQALLEKDITTLKQQYEAQFAKAALLNDAELTDMAFFLEANEKWLQGFLNSFNEFDQSLPDARIVNSELINIEQRSGKLSKDYVLAQFGISAVVGTYTILVIAGGAAGFAVFKTPLGAVVGAGVVGLVAWNTFISYYNKAEEIQSQILFKVDNNVDVNKRAEYIFENGAENELLIFRNYRTLYSKDKDTNIPFAKDFFKSNQELMLIWADLKTKIPFSPSYEPVDASLLETFETSLFRVHSDHLNFSGITNPKVTGSAKKEDGKLFLTFNTAETDAQEFDFKLIYENQDFGKLEKTLDAAVINSGCSVKLELSDKNVLTATATGYGPFKFVWSSGENVTESKTHTVKMARFGDYSVTVTDQNGCESKATATVPCTLRIDVRNEGNTFTVEALDGVPPFNFSWSTNNFANPQTLPSGTHTVKVIDGLGCEILHTINIGCDLEVGIQKDGNNLTAQATGGTAPYTFTWSNGTISSSLSNLAPGTYSVVVKDIVGCEKSASVTIDSEVPENGTFTDPRDGNVYKIVKIGTQTWFAENLRYAGDIPQVVSNEAWAAIWNNGNPTNQPAWAYHDENDPNNNAVYGKLYNWYAVNTGTLCPSGWHIPTDEEWTTLANYLGGPGVAGGKMKSVTDWEAPNHGATNISGFTGLPGGRRGKEGGFTPLEIIGHWWSSSPFNSSFALSRYLTRLDRNLFRSSYYLADGMSCRCLKD